MTGKPAQIDFEKIIRPNDYCKIRTNKFMKKTGIKKGQLVYIAGSQAIPEKDVYTQRIKFLVQLLDEDDKIIMEPMHYMDPKSLERLSEPKRNELHEVNNTGEQKTEIVENIVEGMGELPEEKENEN